MKMTRLMALALCVAACVTIATFAEDDFGSMPTSPVTIDEPVNPQPGMVLKAYHLDKYMTTEGLKVSFSKMTSLPAMKTLVDKGEEFSLKQAGQINARIGMWSGFMKCKKTGCYTLTLTQRANVRSTYSAGGYSMRVNGKIVIPASLRQTSADVNLKAGWNKVDLVCQFGAASALTITYKPKDSLSDARSLTPAMMFYDKKPEEDW